MQDDTSNRSAYRVFAIALIVLLGALATGSTHGQDVDGRMGSLKTATVPGPPPEMLAQYVRDKKAAIQLGKALFWDSRVGSDNKTACASCHFQAGADNRIKNQVSPGLQRRFPSLAINPDRTFQTGVAPNYTLTSKDFPFTKHTDINNAATRSADKNDVVSSQGVFSTSFRDLDFTGRRGADDCAMVPDALARGGEGFSVNQFNTRRVEARNTPSVINAVFNFRNFWDGRGNNIFNGGDPFGLRNAAPLAWKLDGGVVRQVKVALPSSSLASQAVGPPLSGFEMSCGGRTFAKLGQKMVGQLILADQVIAPTDSVLGALSKRRPTYRDLIAQAFQPGYWQSTARVRVSGALKVGSMDMQLHQNFGIVVAPPPKPKDLELSQMEANFGLFFGLAIQLYESTLVSDNTPFDQFAEGKNTLSAQQLQGLAIFQDKGRCVNCHSGPELTSASHRKALSRRLESMQIGNESLKIYDSGFYNIGVRPTTDDVGAAGSDPFGYPLSETLMSAYNNGALLGNGFDASLYDPAFPERANVTGTFKTPSLRNVELTGPYFHNGGKATLMQVVDFYNRGGDFGSENRDNLDPDISPLFLTDPEKESLVAFLVALTDERVRYQRAPFDHPSLCLPHGHPGDTTQVINGGNGAATDINPLQCIKEVGAEGSRTPLAPFLGLRPNQR
jgi:cytochrome c peroxidase